MLLIQLSHSSSYLHILYVLMVTSSKLQWKWGREKFPSLFSTLFPSVLWFEVLRMRLYQPKFIADRYCYLWTFPFGIPLKVFKMHILGRGFHTLMKNVSFPPPTDMGSHNPTPLGSSVLTSTPHLVSTPLQGPTSSLPHRLVSTSFMT